MDFNFGTALNDAARMSPAKTLVVAENGERHTFSQVQARAGAAAAVLAERGIGVGDRVGLRLPNSVDFIVYYFALLGLGATVLPTNPASSARELSYVVDDVEMHALVAVATDAVAHEVLVLTLDVEDLVASEPTSPAAYEPVMVDPSATAVILYTSGSTGEPKGVELSHLNLLSVTNTENSTTPPEEDDVVYAVLPLFHVYGLSDLVNGPVLRRNTIVLRSKFSTQDALEVIERERVTTLPAVPTMLHALVHADITGVDLSFVRTVASGGAPMSPTQVERVRNTFPNASFVEGYGLTETGATGTYNGHPFEFRHGSVGRAMSGLQLVLQGADGNVMPPGPGNVGEVCLRGLSIMKGYWRRPEQTEQALRGGWFHTGDLGWCDEDGYLYITGRSKELIIRGGFNVYPQEVEKVLEAHPSIAQAVVLGRPDEHYGEEVVAFVVRKQDAGAFDPAVLSEYCSSQLAPYKYPRHFIVKASLPVGPTGKVDKRALAAELRTTRWEAAETVSTERIHS